MALSCYLIYYSLLHQSLKAATNHQDINYIEIVNKAIFKNIRHACKKSLILPTNYFELILIDFNKIPKLSIDKIPMYFIEAYTACINKESPHYFTIDLRFIQIRIKRKQYLNEQINMQNKHKY
jgi:hypothetical protein